MRSVFAVRHQQKIYQLFSQASAELMKGAKEFNALLTDLSRAPHHAQKIAQVENQGDQIANATFEYLHRTFIVPFDHYDIQQIIIKLDDILDAMNSAAQRISVYEFDRLPSEMVSIGTLCIRLSELVDNIMTLIVSLKNANKILSYCDAIGKLKSEEERKFMQGLSTLFHEPDPKIIIKTKDIYECLKLIVDCYEDLANVVKSIILEYS